MSPTGNVLWWGRFDPNYSRNRVLRQAFQQLGWSVTDFRPISSLTGDLEAHFRTISKPDLVWVPCFRQRDMAAARRWANKNSVPLVFDPLISAYDKQVNERQLLKAGSLRARWLLRQETSLFQAADLLIADTRAHADYFHSEFSIPTQNLFVVPVGAEEGVFQSLPPATKNDAVEVLFYGTFIDLQGPQVIVEAAAVCREKNIHWTMLGDGPLRKECEDLALQYGLKNLSFEDWVEYDLLPQRIGEADILLGVFGVSGKASRVIPNKVYQSLACGRPVITRHSSAYPAELSGGHSVGLTQIKPGSAEELAAAVGLLADSPEAIISASHNARLTYERYFSANAICDSLQKILQHINFS
jgi:glycosyltransferase involved in cell wall biosynthesis